MAAGPFVPSLVAAASPMVVLAFGLTPGEYGTIATAAFTSAMVFSLVYGRLFDGRSNRTLSVMVISAVGAALATLALAPLYFWLLGAMVLAGFGQSLSTPVTNRIVAEHLAHRSGLAIGLKQSGVQFGQIAASLFVLALPALIGLRWTFAATIVTAVVGVLLVARYVPAQTAPMPSPRRGERTPLPSIVFGLAVYSFLCGTGLQALSVHTPLFAHTELGFSFGLAAFTSTVVGIVGVTSRVMWSGMVRTSSRGLKSLALLPAVGALCPLLLIASQGWSMPALLWVGCALFGASAVASNAVTMLVLTQLIPRENLGRSTAVLMAGLLAGFATGPVVFGFAVEAVGYAWALSAVSAVFAIAAGLIGIWARHTNSRENG